jgi:RNA polymerase sigma-32 factor
LTKIPAPLPPSHTPVKVSKLQLYLQEVSRYPLLSPEEEFELAKKHFEEGDVESAHRLVTANLRLVVKIANEFRITRVSFLDLIQEGNTGLMQAVKKYNPYKGAKLSTYAAWWIRAYILKYLMDTASQVKIATTADQRKLYYNLEKTRRKLLQEFESVSPDQIADVLNVKVDDVIEMQKRLGNPDVSIDAPLQNDENAMTHRDLLAATEESVDEVLANKQIMDKFKTHLSSFRAKLKGRDSEIFDARLMADNPATLQEIGDRYGVSRERVRQIETRILSKLKKFVGERESELLG